MRIDFVSDVSCPWCAIGLKSLEKAGMVQARDAHDVRGKGLYHLTAVGEDALHKWLRAPVGR